MLWRGWMCGSGSVGWHRGGRCDGLGGVRRSHQRCGECSGRLSDTAWPATSVQSPGSWTDSSGGSGSERRIGQGLYPATRIDEQLIGWVPSGQTYDQPPCVSDHSSGNADDPEAHRFQTFAHPLFSQREPLHRRVQIERQHHYRPPRRVRPELPRRQPAPRKVLLQHRMHLLAPSTGSGQALAAPLPVPRDQLIPGQLPVRHHSRHLVPVAIPHLHDGNRQLLLFHVEQRRVPHRLP